MTTTEPPAAADPNSAPRPVLLDCDTGIDDALALTYLAVTPRAELVGIVSTAGNVGLDAVHRNNLALADLLDLPAGLPISRGADRPLRQPQRLADDTHGPSGLGHAVLPVSSRATDPRDGAQLWIDAARAHPGELLGLVIGPSSTLAAAIAREPDLPRLLGGLVLMGGAVNHRGNTAPTTEWNVAVDPEAAQQVFAAFAGLPARQLPVLASLGVTESLELTPADTERLSAIAHPVVPVLLAALRFYMEFHEAEGFGRLCHCHDALAAAVALQPHLGRAEPVALDVELTGTLTRGETVADWLGRWDRPASAAVLTEVDAEAVRSEVLGTLHDQLG